MPVFLFVLMKSIQQQIIEHQQRLKSCRLCAGMTGPVVTGNPVVSRLLLVGQAPGDKEGSLGRPFAWTAGKTLFKWFDSIGISETLFRQSAYMAAVCRCFPGKQPKGGDRVPSDEEIRQCSCWLATEIELLQPSLIIPVGKLAIGQFIKVNKLTEVVGQQHRLSIQGRERDLIPLPHPSGASTWHRMQPGKTLLHQALQLIADHPVWSELFHRQTE